MTEVSLSGKIALEIANRVLTGDWYHIQDAFEALPEDLKDVVSIENGASYTTVWDPAYTETGGTVPGGCTAGAVNVERGGALVWKLPSLLELKANVHFTGGRTLQVKWQVEGEAEQTWTSEKMKKTTLAGWDLMAAAGIQPTDKPVTVKFVNPSSNSGGIRLYDFYVKVYDKGGQSGVTDVAAPVDKLGYYVTDGAIILNVEGVAGARLYDLAGRVVSESMRSQVLPLHGQRGAYVLQVLTEDGRNLVAKVVIR